jgi:hypothetical protein
MNKRALCQDCLRVWECVDLLPSENFPTGTCPVCTSDQRDGNTCNCEDCMQQVRLLEAGDIAGASLHLRPGLTLTAWSPEGGGVTVGTPR